MCGICGVFHFSSQRTPSRRRLVHMSDTLSHRGPDDEGYLLDGPTGLGHKRLSILDLSPTAHQPMASRDQRYWIVFNGEIYNFRELRQALKQTGHAFRSTGDTEVLLTMMTVHGTDALPRLNGMFAFALWDRRDRTLLLARDPFGIKPLYYTIDDGRLIFASEMKAILAYLGRGAELNSAGLLETVTFQYCLDDKTLYRNIHKVPPGHAMRFDQEGAVHTVRYWSPGFDKCEDDEAVAVKRVREILDDSIALQLRSDVDVGCHLSGGIDSASIVGLATRRSPNRLKSFTAGFSEGGVFNDTHHAGISAEHFGTDHAEIFPTPERFDSRFHALMWALEEPVAGNGSFAQDAVSELASRHVKVVLGGQGADELAGGYVRYYLLALEEALKSEISGTPHPEMPLSELQKNLPQLQAYTPLMQSFWSDGLFQSESERFLRLITRQPNIQALLHPDLHSELQIHNPLARFHAVYAAPDAPEMLDRMLHFETTVWLPALLQVEDRTSMAWSLESRVPFLDTRLADYLFSLPTSVKFKHGRLKHLIRAAMADLLPPTILERRNKVGFPVPLSHWFSGPLREWLHDLLLDRRTLERGLFRQTSIEAAISNDSSFNRSIWGLICMESCLRQMVDHNPALTSMDDVRDRPIMTPSTPL
ncbi:MAG: asparagine synthase (glutamine-hydrolyzing) [Magnetococcales bacterium]|nr:asparagine synthase (glutamine-hydrolyzing) [Magnetococcales bacterium]